MSPGGGVEGVGADLDVGAEDDRDDVQELAVGRLLREPARKQGGGRISYIIDITLQVYNINKGGEGSVAAHLVISTLHPWIIQHLKLDLNSNGFQLYIY